MKQFETVGPNAQVHRPRASPVDRTEKPRCARSGATASSARCYRQTRR